MDVHSMIKAHMEKTADNHTGRFNPDNYRTDKIVKDTLPRRVFGFRAPLLEAAYAKPGKKVERYGAAKARRGLERLKGALGGGAAGALLGAGHGYLTRRGVGRGVLRGASIGAPAGYFSSGLEESFRTREGIRSAQLAALEREKTAAVETIRKMLIPGKE